MTTTVRLAKYRENNCHVIIVEDDDTPDEACRVFAWVPKLEDAKRIIDLINPDPNDPRKMNRFNEALLSEFPDSIRKEVAARFYAQIGHHIKKLKAGNR